MEAEMKRNLWKTLFWVLLGCNAVILFVIILLFNWPVEQQEKINYASKEEDIQFQVKTTRDDLNRLINQYLNTEEFTGSFHYEVYLTDEVELYGKIPFFNRELDLKLTFQPIAQDNGDLVLKQESISVGQMDLPVSYVMNFIDKKYKMPEWVDIQPKSQSIYVSLQNMKLKSDVRVKAKKFNLKKDDISFVLIVPSANP